MIQKQNTYIGLHKQPILITDSVDNSQYFNISEFPDRLTSGINSFKIYGNSELLVKGTEILIEVVDGNNFPIFHQVNQYKDSSGYRIISIYIYKNTLPGQARITIVGKAKKRPNRTDVPVSWEDKYNVRWSRIIPLQPEKPNTTSILFEQPPNIKIEEVERYYKSRDFTIGVHPIVIAEESGRTINSITTDTNTKLTDVTLTNHISPSAGGGFTPDMLNVVLTIKQIPVSKIEQSLEQYRETPQDQFLLLDPRKIKSYERMRSRNTGRAVNIPIIDEQYYPDISPTVLHVKNSNTLTVSEIVVPVMVLGIDRILNVPLNIFSNTNTHSNFTIKYQQLGTEVDTTTNIQSFAKMEIVDLDPIAGDIYMMKSFVKSQGFGSYTMIGETLVENNNLLNNPNSSNPYSGAGHFINQSAVDNLWTTSSPWQQSGDQYPAAIQDNSIIMGGVLISGSEDLPSTLDNTPKFDELWSTQGVLFKSNFNVQVYEGQSYTITFEAGALALDDQTDPCLMELWISGSNLISDNSIKNGEFNTSLGQIRGAVLTGPSIVTPNADNISLFSSNLTDETLKQLATPTYTISKDLRKPIDQSTLNWAHENPGNFLQSRIPGAEPLDPEYYLFQSKNKIDRNVVQSTFPPGIVKKKLIQYTFTPDSDDNINIRFNIIKGKWFIGNVQVKGDRQSGFTPSHTFFEFPVPTAQQDDILDFKFEFYNRNMQQANIAVTVNGVDFRGSNLYVGGRDNYIPGTLVIGDGFLIEGFEGD